MRTCGTSPPALAYAQFWGILTSDIRAGALAAESVTQANFRSTGYLAGRQIEARSRHHRGEQSGTSDLYMVERYNSTPYFCFFLDFWEREIYNEFCPGYFSEKVPPPPRKSGHVMGLHLHHATLHNCELSELLM